MTEGMGNNERGVGGIYPPGKRGPDGSHEDVVLQVRESGNEGAPAVIPRPAPPPGHEPAPVPPRGSVPMGGIVGRRLTNFGQSGNS